MEVVGVDREIGAAPADTDKGVARDEREIGAPSSSFGQSCVRFAGEWCE